QGRTCSARPTGPGPGAGAGGAGVQGAGATGSGTGAGGGAGGGGAGWVVRVRWRPGGAQAGRRQIGSQARKDRSSESRISDLLGMDAAWNWTATERVQPP